MVFVLSVDRVTWVAIAISSVALMVSARALFIAEREHRERERERRARAKLRLDVEPWATPVPDGDGVYRLDERTGRYVALRLTLINEGDRDAGRTRVEVRAPLATGGGDSQWITPACNPRPSPDDQAGRISSVPLHPRLLPLTCVLSRTLAEVAVEVPEELYFRFTTAHAGGNIDAYPIEIRVDAEGADEPLALTHRVLVGSSSA